MKKLPFEGVRVLDLTMMWAGPYATKLVAEMGAEVLKVESPRNWDNIRTLVPQPGVAEPWNSAYYFNEYSRMKKSVVLDLSDERGRDAFFRLLRHTDVVIENYRAEVLDNLGLGYETLRRHKADIILVSMAAFGKTGPERNNVGFGPVIELMSGLASLSGYGDDGEPYKSGISYGDPVGGTAAVAAIALALLERRRTGEGSFVDLAQREGASTLAGEAFVRASLHGEVEPRHLGNRSDRWAPQGVYRTRVPVERSGEPAQAEQWLAISVTSDDEWRACCGVIGRADLAGLSASERAERHDELDGVLGAWCGAHEGQPAMEALQAAGVPAGRVIDTGDIHDDPNLLARNFWVHLPHPQMIRYKQAGVSWRLVEAQPRLTRHSPLFGEHTREALRDIAGMSDAEVDALYEAGVTADAPVNPGVG